MAPLKAELIWRQKRVRWHWKMTQDMQFTVAECGSICEQNAEAKGREEGETDRHGPIQLCLRCQWLTQHVIPLLFFRAIIDPTTSSPLRVSIPASVYVGVCACRFVFSCDKLKMIQMRLLRHSPLPKPHIWQIQRCLWD